jgi:DNA-binding transcriptional regulator YbjK
MEATALKLVPQQTDAVEEKALSIVEQAGAVVVTDSESYSAAGTLWKSLGDMIKEVKDTFDPICDAANKAHKAATAKRAKFLDPLAAAYKSVKGLMEAYDKEQARIAKAEQDRLEEIARQEEEKRRQEELDRLKAESDAEQERLLEAAMAAEAAGNTEQAERLTEAAVSVSEAVLQEAAVIASEPVAVAPIVVQKAVPKLQGGPVFREVWAAEVTDIKALCRAVAEGRASTECVMANMPVLNRMASALKATMNVPGVRAYSKRV